MNTSKKSVYTTHPTEMHDGKPIVEAHKGDDPYTIVARYDHQQNLLNSC